jgi:hypothetical protein
MISAFALRGRLAAHSDIFDRVSHHSRFVVVASPIVFVACIMRGPEPQVAFDADASASASLTAPATSSHFTNISAEAHLKTLLADAHNVFESPRFAMHLAAIHDVTADADGEHLNGRALVDALSHAKLSIEYRLAGEGGSCNTAAGETAHTDPPTSTPPSANATTCVETALIDHTDPIHPDAYACGIDTIVHEWMHAIVDAKGTPRFTDKGHRGAKFPLVTYTVGAVAQCTYLEEQLGELPPADFVKCVEAIGVRSLRSETCEERWFEDERWNGAADGT